jgi:hypothetical protein
MSDFVSINPAYPCFQKYVFSKFLSYEQSTRYKLALYVLMLCPDDEEIFA